MHSLLHAMILALGLAGPGAAAQPALPQVLPVSPQVRPQLPQARPLLTQVPPALPQAWEEAGEAALLHLPPQRDTPPPVIIMLPDAVQRDARHERYLEHLLASGFAVVVPMSDDVAPDWVLRRVRRDGSLDGRRIGVLGFGAGAAVALGADAAGRAMPRALLYPGCGHLPLPAGPSALLLLHGDADPANPLPACLADARDWAAGGGRVEHHVLSGVGYAWDLEPLGGFRRAMLPAPGLSHRIPVVPDAEATEQAADVVAQFFRGQLDRRGS